MFIDDMVEFFSEEMSATSLSLSGKIGTIDFGYVLQEEENRNRYQAILLIHNNRVYGAIAIERNKKDKGVTAISYFGKYLNISGKKIAGKCFPIAVGLQLGINASKRVDNYGELPFFKNFNFDVSQTFSQKKDGEGCNLLEMARKTYFGNLNVFFTEYHKPKSEHVSA